MRRLLPILVPLLCAIPARAGISAPVSFCVSGTTSGCTLNNALTFSDFGYTFVGFWYRSGSNTPPTAIGGWDTVERATGANTNSIYVAVKHSLGNETTCPAATNQTQMGCAVYPGTWYAATDVFGDKTTGGTSGTTLTYTSPGLSVTDGSSWVIGVAGAASATNVDQAPSGSCGTPTLRTGTSVNNIALWDTAGGVTSCTSPTLTISPSSAYRFVTFEMLGTPSAVASAASNKVFDYYPGQDTSTGCTGTPCHWTFPVQSSLANNELVIAWIWQYTSQPSVTSVYCNSDTGHATWTWTQAGTSHDAGNSTDGFIYYSSNAPAGCTVVTVEASGPWANATGHYTEYKGVKTFDKFAGTQDGTTTGTAPYINNASITPATSGELLHYFCSADTLDGSASTAMFVSSGVSPWLLDFQYSTVAAGLIWNSTNAVTVTSFGQGMSPNTMCLMAAFKTDGTGTSPSGDHFTKIAIMDSAAEFATANMEIPYDNAGDNGTIVANGVFTANTKQFGTLTSEIGSYTLHQISNSGGGWPNWALDCDLQSAGIDWLTFGTAANTSLYVFWETSGPNNSSHTACFDATMDTPTSSGSCSGTTCGPAPSATPSTANGILIASSETGTGPSTAVTAPVCAVMDVPTYEGQSDAQRMGAGNWFGHCLVTSTSAQSWTWTNVVSGTGYSAEAIHLMDPAGGGTTVVPALPLLGVGVGE